MAIHGGDIYGTDIQKTVEEGKEILDFSANINPLGMPESVRQAVMTSLSAAEHYPGPGMQEVKASAGQTARNKDRKPDLRQWRGRTDLSAGLCAATEESTSDSPYLCRI